MHTLQPLYLALELLVAAFFAATLWAALRRGRLPFLELISAASFGLLLEEGDQLIFGTYHYAPDFILTLDRAPLVIGLTWALIIAGAMRITDALGVRGRYAPVVDSLLAISLDLSFDAIAIRMGLWTWRGVPSTAGWFGVPAGNFYAWLFVTLAFSLLTRWLRDASARQPARQSAREWLQLGVPLPAFAILLTSLVPFSILKPIVDPVPGGGMLLFLPTLAAFAVVGAIGIFGRDRGNPNGARLGMLDLRLAFGTRLAIHGFFLGALVVLNLATQLPALLAVSLVLTVAELPLARVVWERHRRIPAPMGATPRPTPDAALPQRAR